MSQVASIAVVIPAYNAAATLDRTLESVRAQSFADIEILVVDDGSQDATPEIAARHAAVDARVRLLRQANAGVAAARNHGVASTDAPLLAVIDADDLWAADALALLHTALDADDAIGLAYGGYSLIDPADQVLRSVLPQAEGDVMRALARRNIVGNGSGVLFRRQAWIDAGGYDPALHAAGAQGCEDHLFYFRVAQRWRFATVQAPLLGYRMAPGAMSAQFARMWRSYELCVTAILAASPELVHEVQAGCADYRRWLLRRAITFGPWRATPGLFAAAARDDAMAAVRAAAAGLRHRFAAAGTTFETGKVG